MSNRVLTICEAALPVIQPEESRQKSWKGDRMRVREYNEAIHQLAWVTSENNLVLVGIVVLIVVTAIIEPKFVSRQT